MKNIAFIILLIYVWALSKPMILIVDYHVNTEEIIADFCINKEDADLDCQGHCYLKKKLEEAQDDDSSPTKDFDSKKQTKLEKKNDHNLYVMNYGELWGFIDDLKPAKFSYLVSDSQYLLEIDCPPPIV